MAIGSVQQKKGESHQREPNQPEWSQGVPKETLAENTGGIADKRGLG